MLSRVNRVRGYCNQQKPNPMNICVILNLINCDAQQNNTNEYKIKFKEQNDK